MNVSNAKYLIKEGFKSFWTNGLMSAASAVIVTASLIIFGIYILFTLNINFMGQQFMSQYEIQIYLNDVSEARVKEMQEQIGGIAHVTGVTYVTKEEALAEFRKNMGESSSMLDGLENDNPLPASFKITMDNLSYSQQVADQISAMPDVFKVKNNKDFMENMLKITAIIRNSSLWLMIFLSLIAVFIISNTIKITVYARRREINIMKYIGATDRFISWPFIIEGITIGLVGAIISLLAVTLAYNYVNPQIAAYLGSGIRTYFTREILWQIAAWFFGIGTVLGAVGSAISLRRHLQV